MNNKSLISNNQGLARAAVMAFATLIIIAVAWNILFPSLQEEVFDYGENKLKANDDWSTERDYSTTHNFIYYVTKYWPVILLAAVVVYLFVAAQEQGGRSEHAQNPTVMYKKVRFFPMILVNCPSPSRKPRANHGHGPLKWELIGSSPPVMLVHENIAGITAPIVFISVLRRRLRKETKQPKRKWISLELGVAFLL